jgi:hypothetical protein
MMKKIKGVIDPNNILNPGKIFTMEPRCEGTLPLQENRLRNFTYEKRQQTE